jgi:hypothetical protein
MLSESEDAWTSAYDDDHGGSIDDIFSGRDSVFDNEKEDTSNPVLQHNEENVLENPTEGPVQWKMVDGHPVPVSGQAGSSPASVQGQAHLRKTLVAVEGPKGLLVARAVRNLRTGQVQHLEPMRLPTPTELAEVQTKAQVVPAPSNLGATAAAATAAAAAAAVTGAPAPLSTQVIKSEGLPWGKIALGAGAVAAAWFIWKKTQE